MFVKSFALLGPVLIGGAWIAGVFDSAAYSRDVARTPDQVMAGIADLDLQGQPGEAGSDPSLSGGARPVFRTERGEDSMTFLVMSGDQVAVRMTAHLQPLDDGRRTRVTATVERGDAPDDLVAPAFRSTGVTLGLFSMALEEELDELTAPPRRSAEECREIAERVLMANAGNLEDSRERTFAGGARTILRVNAAAAELRRNGCPVEGGGNFEPISDEMSEGEGGDYAP